MASPFQVFRKNQKWMIATAGLIAIFAFVFADPLTSMMQGSGGPGGVNTPVARTVYGKITERQLDNMLHMRRIANRFLQEAWTMGQMAGGRYDERPMPRTETERAVVEDMLLAKKAEEMGFAVSNKVLNDYLKAITGDVLKAEQYQEIVENLFTLDGRSVTMAMVFDTLRQEMLASKLEARYSMPIISSPGQTWEYYRRLNDVMQVELLPVPVEKYLSQVPDPSEEVLAAFFAKYQNEEVGRDFINDVPLESPEPGFKMPHRIGFGFVRLDMEKIVELNSAEVTEKEIADYYKDHMAEFEVSNLLGQPGATGEPTTGAANTAAGDANDPDVNPEGDDIPPTNLNLDGPPADLPQDGTAESSDAEPADEEPADEEGSLETEAPEAEPESTEEPAEVPTEEPATEESQEEAAETDSGQFNVLDEEAAAETDAAETDVADTDADPEQTEAATEAVADESAPPETADDTADDTAEDEPKEAASSEAPADLPAETPTDSESPAAEDSASAVAADPEKKYQPLAEVSEQIRRQIALHPERIEARREELLKPIIDAMNGYATQLGQWEAAEDAKGGEAAASAKPKLPDVKKLAEASGLVYDSIEPTSVLEFVDHPLGRSYILADGRRVEQLFAQAFSNRMQDFKAVMAEDVEGNAYAVWQTEDIPDAVPELKEIRPQVVRTWKLLQARELAKKDAETLAEKARESGEPLREYFAQREDPPLIITEPFTWLTYGAVPSGQMGRAPRLATLDGVPNAGPEFMSAISKLEGDEVGVAVNHPQTVYYVARVARHDVPEATLRKRFLESAEVASAQNLARRDLYFSVVEGLRDSIAEEARLDWIRPPDTQRR